MVVEIFVIVIILATALAFWPWIRDFFTENVIPWIRGSIGENVAELVTDFIVWLDGRLAKPSAYIRKCYSVFKEHVLGTKTEYTKTSATEATSTTETYVHLKDGKVGKQTVQGKVAWEDLPASVRSEMMRQNKHKASLDAKDAILEMGKKRANEEGMTLED